MPECKTVLGVIRPRISRAQSLWERRAARICAAVLWVATLWVLGYVAGVATAEWW